MTRPHGSSPPEASAFSRTGSTLLRSCFEGGEHLYFHASASSCDAAQAGSGKTPERRFPLHGIIRLPPASPPWGRA